MTKRKHAADIYLTFEGRVVDCRLAHEIGDVVATKILARVLEVDQM